MDAPAFRMIDVGTKPASHRLAVATGRIRMSAEAFRLVASRSLPKGDALLLAEISGIQGAKRASDFIPLCHPLPLDQVRIVTILDETDAAVDVFCFVSAFAKTGVEMEALAGVQSALLAIYDLVKMIEPALTIENIRLLVKTGGKKGVWLCPDGVPPWIVQEIGLNTEPALKNIHCAVLTLSDRASAGIYEDKSGARLSQILRDAGVKVIHEAILPDDQTQIAVALRAIIAEQSPALIITTGGTGISPRDVTPETIATVCDRLIPGIGEKLRQYSEQFTAHSWSSRSLAGISGKTLIIALPGNPKAVKESMDCLLPLLPHLLGTIAGKKHDHIS